MKLFRATSAIYWMLCLTGSFVPAQTAADQAAEAAKVRARVPVVPQSRTVNVSYAGKVTTFTVEDLLKLPQVTVKVHNAYHNTDESYAGPLLSEVLAHAGLKPSIDTEWAMLHSSLVATGNFNYFVVYSVAEVEPSYSTRQVIVALTKSGLPNTEGGIIELVNTIDSNAVRWVRGLADLTVVKMAPVK